MSGTRLIPGWAVVMVALALLLACAGVGCAIGRGEAPTTWQAAVARAQAARDAARPARRTAYLSARRRGMTRGGKLGARRAALVAADRGTAAGKAEAERRAAARAAAAEAQRKADQEQRHGNPCVIKVDGACEAEGPGITGQPCPPGSEPNADGGVVCVPHSLVEKRSQEEGGE